MKRFARLILTVSGLRTPNEAGRAMEATLQPRELLVSREKDQPASRWNTALSE